LSGAADKQLVDRKININSFHGMVVTRSKRILERWPWALNSS